MTAFLDVKPDSPGRAAELPKLLLTGHQLTTTFASVHMASELGHTMPRKTGAESCPPHGSGLPLDFPTGMDHASQKEC